MKLTMEIQGHNSGQSDHRKNPGEKVDWAAIWGKDNNGRYARAVVYGPVAVALNAEIAGKLSEDEVVSAKRMVINLEGEWKTRTVNENGKEEKQRNFWGEKFSILDGMALENARLRRDATVALQKAEKMREAGHLALAYEAVAQFVANYAGVPLDLEQFLSDTAAEEVEYGASNADINPEALAAAHFARNDALTSSDAPAETVEAAPSEEVADEQVEEATPMDFGTEEEEVLGAVAGSDDIAEEDAITLDATPEITDEDVLEDAPVQEPVREEAAPAARQERPAPGRSAPPFVTSKPPFVRPSAPFSPAAAASRPFSRPELSREAPQPSARPAPVAEQNERPAPPFARKM